MNYFLDSFNEEGIQKPKSKVKSWKSLLIFAVLLLLFGLFVYQSFNLQILKHHSYAQKAEENSNKQEYVLPERGIIYSRDGKPLVQNKPLYSLVIDLNKFNRFKKYRAGTILNNEERAFLNESKTSLPSDFEELFNQSLQLGKDYFVLKNEVDQDDYYSLQSSLSSLGNTNLKLQTLSYRDYADSKYFSHVLGYVGSVSKDELDSDGWYTPNAKIGKSGLEKEYENYLRGEKGLMLREYKSDATLLSENLVKKPVDGYNLHTTLDYSIQKTAYNSLKKYIKESDATGGSAVVQNPNTGEVLAMVSLPAYDNNKFSKKIDLKTYNQLINNPNKPLQNRAVSYTYPPASTFKIVTSTAGLEEEVLTTEDYIDDPGIISVGDFTYKTWKEGGHGRINVVGALKESSDTFFYILGGGHDNFPQINPLGVDRLYKWAKLYGFGSKLGVDIPNEVSGVVPTKDWKEENIGERWYIGNTYHLSIGQGFLTATPLQVNSMTAVIANGGQLIKPYIANKVVNIDNNKNILNKNKTVIRDLDISSDTLTTVRKGLEEAVSTGGTAYPLFDYPVTVIGKTGTAEFGGAKSNKTHAWFTGYAPKNNPEIVATVVVEGGGGGSDVAAPVVKDIFDEYFDLEESEGKDNNE